jgi:branched-chain amino acid transport system ATP-binding protein
MSLLECIGLSKHYGDLWVIQELTFHLKEGEILGLIGPNGAGKTTLINIITGALTFSKGDILFRKKTLRGLKAYQIARLGVTKTYEIVPPSTQMSALENVMVGALFGNEGQRKSWREARKKAEKILDVMGLVNQKDLPVGNLNVFETKCLKIAKALSINPQLLLLDEITGGLNPTEIKKASGLIQNIRAGGVSVLVVEHLMKTIVQLSDRVIVLHRGEKIMEGSAEEVLKNEKVIQAYLGNRFGELMPSE